MVRIVLIRSDDEPWVLAGLCKRTKINDAFGGQRGATNRRHREIVETRVSFEETSMMNHRGDRKRSCGMTKSRPTLLGRVGSVRNEFRRGYAEI